MNFSGALFLQGFDADVPWIAGKHQARHPLFTHQVFVRGALEPRTHVLLSSLPGVPRLRTHHLGGL
jgi:hypothetical protein